MPHLREITATFSHPHLEIIRHSAEEAVFRRGDRLLELRRAADSEQLPLFFAVLMFGLTFGAVRLMGVGCRHSFVAPEAGMMVSLAGGGWQPLRHGQLLLRYVPLAEWEAFAAALGEQERFILQARAASAAKPAEDPAASRHAAAAAQVRDEITALTERLEALYTERTRLLAALAEREAPAGTAPPTQPPLANILAHFPEPEVLACATRAAEVAVAGLTLSHTLGKVLVEAFGLPLTDLALIRRDARLVCRIEEVFSAMDARIGAALSDPELTEDERQLRLAEWTERRRREREKIFTQSTGTGPGAPPPESPGSHAVP